MKVLLDIAVLTDGEPPNLDGIIKNIIRRGIVDSPLQGRSNVDITVGDIEIMPDGK